MITKEETLKYHREPVPGKLASLVTKPCATQKDLSMAYSPGVAYPCLDIEKNPDDAFLYTNRGNLVGVISDGTAVLGLGDIGPLAGKPVMEGKGVLFKKFAGIDVFDIELATKDTEAIIATVKNLEPTFGGINLEDISAPRCFEIEERLIEMMDIPVFHDDQHGTAIISSAAIVNASVIAKKDIGSMRVVINGAGASALASAKLYLEVGIKKENIIICDSTGVIYKGREKNMNKYKDVFAVDTKLRTLADAINGADVFVGLSVAGALKEDMLKSMAKTPVVFALANPDPEMPYSDIKRIRPDAIAATGRSDFPNQVNNVLGFPAIFRGALDVRARKINTAMKLAAVHELARLAKEPVPADVLAAYGLSSLSFGIDYIIPKPFDRRVLLSVAPAVAKAAMASGVARITVEEDAYRAKLATLI
ncbi:MAG: hypothetical protein HZC28_07895 [Spirochaetes bacterium]|nr:hypothetical protein [Spirochaetota bacterium]